MDFSEIIRNEPFVGNSTRREPFVGDITRRALAEGDNTRRNPSEGLSNVTRENHLWVTPQGGH